MAELSYDGFGINDARNEYKPRIATFTRPEYGNEFGKLFEAAPEMAELLKDILVHLENGHPVYPGALIFAEDAPARDVIRAALMKAGIK